MISIILPTYNEKENIKELIDSIIKVLRSIKYNSYEIIVVDDDSPDRTSDIVEKYIMKNKKIKLIKRINKKGLATAIREGIEVSRGEYLIFMDADFSHPPEFIKNIIETIEKTGFDVVIASRYVKGGDMDAEKYKYFLSRILNLFLGFVLQLKIMDLTGGFFIIRRPLLYTIKIDKIFVGQGDYFFKLFYMLKKHPYSYIEIPFIYKRRRHGNSKMNIYKAGIKYIKSAFSFCFRNMSFT